MRRKIGFGISEPRETNYLASVSDLMAGLLFIFIIALTWQIIEFQQEKERQETARSELLQQLKSRLDTEGIYVVIDTTSGVLRIPDTALTFDTGKANLTDDLVERLKTIRRVFEEELICYQYGSISKECHKKNKYHHHLDAVFIEGHTDSQAYSGDMIGLRNRLLSAERANKVYSVLMYDQSEDGISELPLFSMKNSKGQPLFSLSGYGATRPITKTKEDDVRENRRIEFRFLMNLETAK